MLLMFVYGELSSKKNKQKNVHLLLPQKVCAVFKKETFFFFFFLFFCQFKKKKKKKHIQSQHLTLRLLLRSLWWLRKNYLKQKKKGYHASLGTRESINHAYFLNLKFNVFKILSANLLSLVKDILIISLEYYFIKFCNFHL